MAIGEEIVHHFFLVGVQGGVQIAGGFSHGLHAGEVLLHALNPIFEVSDRAGVLTAHGLTHFHLIGVVGVLGRGETLPSIFLIRLQFEPRLEQFHPLGAPLLLHRHVLLGIAAHPAVALARTAAHHRAVAPAAPRAGENGGAQAQTGDSGGGQ